ncbi:MAG TPA: PIG-L family deacetylase [Cyclobacteriaceae bacterium]|nr:PIG-L family deacetylase [Cyclobacteriaceae bacterium]
MRRFVFALFLPLFSYAQVQVRPDAAEILLRLKKLNVLGSVMYVAAHPDDENTRIIAFMANDRLAATAYLSMTRGDGGQNLIGPEIRDQLGLIRTQELLAARRIDGGQQFFTRANDFGFSKSAEETLKIWGKEEILSDVVKIYREFQPDVILTRFPADARAGHGHHTSSAILAQEAFDVAADASRFPEQVKTFGIWKPKRLYTNTGRWWNTTINENTPGIVTVNVGSYNPLLGQSYSELAAISRSQHKSQGFGSQGTRGEQLEFFEYVKGDQSVTDFFEGINTTWSRLKGGEKVKPLVEKAIHEFDMQNPSASVTSLLQIRKEILLLDKSVWRERKLKEVTSLIVDCLGLYSDVLADQFRVAPGESVQTTIEIVNRSPVDVQLESILANGMSFDSTLNVPLQNNELLVLKSRKQASGQLQYSDPYWLREPHSTGLFTVNDKDLIGKPENDPAIQFTFNLRVSGENIQLVRPLVYRWTDPVKGEQQRPFEVLPPILLKISNGVWIFNNNDARHVDVMVTSNSQNILQGVVKLSLPPGWSSEPLSIPVELKKKGEEVTSTFRVIPPKGESVGTIKAVAEVNGRTFDHGLQTISYDHIPTQTLLPVAESQIFRIDLKKEGDLIGYINGAGDDIPSALRNIGYSVVELKNEEVTPENLKKMDAVVLGIRALNTNDRIDYIMPNLLEYVKSGGTVVVQYNTSNGLRTNQFSPYKLSLSRNRVTEEDSPVNFLVPDHPVLNSPNKIIPKDFEGWVQERGLYFPDKWDDHFVPILSMNDKNEAPLDGGLLVAKYGEGYYVYTGLSFFRELPEGIPGAYKLFANIVSIGEHSLSGVSTTNTKRRSRQ